MSLLICRKIAVLKFIVFAFQLRRNGMHFTSSEKASSVPGRMHTAVVESSGAANPRVPVLKLVVASLSPTLADSVARVGIAWHHRSRGARIRPVRNCRGGVDQ